MLHQTRTKSGLYANRESVHRSGYFDTMDSSGPAHDFTAGSIKINSLLTLPAIPMLVAEWSSLLPLICHLANYRYEHQVVGDLALRGALHVPLFPRLGVLLGIAKLLANNASFLDEASCKGASADTVYDVNWGSVFPCANGAASRSLAQYALERAGAVFSAFDCSTGARDETGEKACGQRSPADSTSSKSSKPAAPLHPTPLSASTTQSTLKAPANPGFRRYQTLQVIHVSRHPRPRTNHVWLRSVFLPRVIKAATWVSLLALITICAMVGAYGTAVILLVSVVADGLCAVAGMRVERPPGYLSNNEAGEGCMLVSIHENANIWQLYLGDRGVVDALLNKTMITFVGPLKLLSGVFYVAHAIQLLAMTYVAAQKGFDGIFLLSLMLLTWAVEWFRGQGSLARNWLRTDSVTMTARSFRFTGRMPLLGTVQLLSGTAESSWMDVIAKDCPRRQAWLECLDTGRTGADEVETQREKHCLNSMDVSWLKLNNRLAFEGHAMVVKELARARSQPTLAV